MQHSLFLVERVWKERNVFVKNISITDAMIYMVNSICEIVNKDRYLSVVFLDLSKVFHSVTYGVLQKIGNLGTIFCQMNCRPTIRVTSLCRQQYGIVNSHKSQTSEVGIYVSHLFVLGAILTSLHTLNDLIAEKKKIDYHIKG